MVLRPEILAVFVALTALAGCERERWTAAESDRGAIEVARDRLAIHHGTVGVGQWEREASFVLVPARNTSDRDLIVTLRGRLIEGDERRELMPESLRIPTGGERTFALVDRGQALRPSVTAAEIEVSGALSVDYPPSVTVSDGNVYQDQGRAVVAGNVANHGRGEAKVSVIAAFYDPAGMPMKRPFTVLRLAGGGERGVQLVGPPGSATAQLYVGEVQY